MEADKKNDNLEQNSKNEELSHMTKVIITGFVGGVFWSFIGYIAYYFNFTEMGPALILQPWAFGEWKNDTAGHLLGIVAIGIVSIGAAILYNAVFRNILKLWPSIVYGIVLWIFVFYLLNPIFPNLEEVKEFNRNTIITTVCLYVLFGVFVGYSISYDAEQTKKA
ncbi:YqhR family membrane protein [Calidifontibacillus oryziterrae]|uniref:YqhR family membrane protein n=1 Tax=Calidifontibacillus oryziterrae TaxID=1191699 RepID=UPI0003095103|nr:YqhR family membrane protein [Calidifontibacillus oryziterrae]